MGRKNRNKSKEKVIVKKITGNGDYKVKDLVRGVKNMAVAAVRGAKSGARALLKNESVGNMISEGIGTLSDRFVPGSHNTVAGLSKLLMRRVRGKGDYDLGGDPISNSLFKRAPETGSSGNALMPPKFENSRSAGGVCVVHREFAMNLVVPEIRQAFSTFTLGLNPGNATIFPWLSNIATDFQLFRFKGVVIEFVSFTSPMNLQPAMGYIMMSGVYNVLQAPYENSVELENSAEAIVFRPDRSAMYGMECKDTNYRKYFVLQPTAQIIDDALYTPFNIQIATEGLPDTFQPGSVLGQIWISYEIEFFEPLYRFPSGGSNLLLSITGPSTANNDYDYLWPFSANNTANYNYTGRFAPYTLNGKGDAVITAKYGQPIVHNATPTYVISDVNLLHFDMSNFDPGSGVIVQFTMLAVARNPDTGPATNYLTSGGYLPAFSTPGLTLTHMVGCGTTNLSGYIGESYSQYGGLSGCNTGLYAGNAVLPLQFTANSNSFLQYTYTWYVTIVSSNASFDLSPVVGYHNTDSTAYGYLPNVYINNANYQTMINSTLVKYSDSQGYPTLYPYTIPSTPTSVALSDNTPERYKMVRPQYKNLTKTVSELAKNERTLEANFIAHVSRGGRNIELVNTSVDLKRLPLPNPNDVLTRLDDNERDDVSVSSVRSR